MGDQEVRVCSSLSVDQNAVAPSAASQLDTDASTLPPPYFPSTIPDPSTSQHWDTSLTPRRDRGMTPELFVPQERGVIYRVVFLSSVLMVKVFSCCEMF